MTIRGLFLFIACMWLVIPANAQAKPIDKETYELLELFGDVFERVRRDYVEEVEDEKLIESALNGMLTALDPHSGYLSRRDFREMQVQTKGEFGGLGIEVTMENGLVKVVSPIDDTPAFKAGIEAGDFISQIDGEPVLGLTLSEAVDKMRGKVGTDITVTVLRESDSEPLEITITRDIIKIQSVRHQVFDDIGYLRITSFSQKTDAGVREAIKKMKKDIPNMKGMVLDLRNNPGGLLDQAVAVSDDFLEQGEVVSTRERNPSNTRRYTAHPGDLINGKPIVVLINQGSASASEIVAGALQDHNRAVIMGTKSFGKGSVQTVIPLDSHGAMRLTTSRYYTPSGTSIQAKGIMPDIIVEQAKIEQEDTKKRRSEANLPGRLKNDQGDEEEEKPTSRRNRKVDPNKDFQLARAVDLLRGVAVFDSLDSRQY